MSLGLVSPLIPHPRLVSEAHHSSLMPHHSSGPCRCRQLLSEQEVQARAADAARANVELHIAHLGTAYQSFLDRWGALDRAEGSLVKRRCASSTCASPASHCPLPHRVPHPIPTSPYPLPSPYPPLRFLHQHKTHGALLAGLESDLGLLSRISLHPALQVDRGRTHQNAVLFFKPSNTRLVLCRVSHRHSCPFPSCLLPAAAAMTPSSPLCPSQSPSWRSLEDLAPMARLREWGAHCRRGHDHFASKAAELDADLLALRREVEGLLVQVGLEFGVQGGEGLLVQVGLGFGVQGGGGAAGAGGARGRPACMHQGFLPTKTLPLPLRHPPADTPPTQVPSVDLNGLGSDLSRAEGAVDELSLVVQVRGMLVITWPRTRNARYVNFHLHCGRAGPVQGLAYCQGAG